MRVALQSQALVADAEAFQRLRVDPRGVDLHPLAEGAPQEAMPGEPQALPGQVEEGDLQPR
jgi:hypothetical protein